ncbi:RNA-directed DNA polymerase, eukaryota, reverse transcriptase zinc-binding domain protein [Tanacetum coccineum]|uniref:RNA-directed DNA polymerase, eukaryota, reverse transcriptase zinc-binding domain protein n=1 Tax=Tanacetum coccineum TaxID=301880 RepID=A0ABQ5BMY7_9ASTR
MESLHLSVQRLVDAGLFLGITICPSIHLSHLLYADDAVFLGQWSEGNINVIVKVLDCFHRASGLHINMNKSKLIGISVDNSKIVQAASKIGCAPLKTPFLYLGTKVGGIISRTKSWEETVNKFDSRLSKWKRKTLSIGGRITLIKSVLGSLPIYNMSIYKVPQKIIHRLESSHCHFFNGTDRQSKKPIWVKWNKVLAPKDKGGLRILSFYALNRGLLFKCVWRFYMQESSLWTKVIKGIHGQDGKIGKNLSKHYSSIWLDIGKELDLFKQKGMNFTDYIHRKMGNGIDTSFWVDVWKGDKALKYQFPRIYALESNKNISVATNMGHDNLEVSLRRSPRGGVEQVVDYMAINEVFEEKLHYTKYVTRYELVWIAYWAAPASSPGARSCTKSSDSNDPCISESKPLALLWGQTPRLDFGARVRDHVVRGFNFLLSTMGTIDDIRHVLTQPAFDALCEKYHIPPIVHPELPYRSRIHNSPPSKIGVYSRFFDFANYRIPLYQFLVDILEHFEINLSQLSVIAAAKVSHFEILCRVHGFVPTVANFSKRRRRIPTPTPDEFDAGVCNYLATHTAPFLKFLEAFLCLVGISRYYNLDENVYLTFLADDDEGGCPSVSRTKGSKGIQVVRKTPRTEERREKRAYRQQPAGNGLPTRKEKAIGQEGLSKNSMEMRELISHREKKGADKREEEEKGLYLPYQRYDEERIKHKSKQVDNQDRLLFTRYQEQGRMRGHGGFNQSRGQENNFKKETHNNSNKLTHDKSKVMCFKCKEYGHYANRCPLKKEEQSNLIEEDLQPQLLMAIIEESQIRNGRKFHSTST